MDKIKTTIAVLAYRPGDNLYKIIDSLLSQRYDFTNSPEIIIHIDNAKGESFSELQSRYGDKINVILSKERRGFSGSVVFISKNFDGDILVLLNDDIYIKDDLFIHKLIKPIIRDSGVGYVCADRLSLPHRGFIEKAIISSKNAYRNMYLKMDNKNSVYTCDGKAMAFSRDFIKSDIFPDNLSKMGNVDSYLYFVCLKKGFKYEFAGDAHLYYRSPSVFSEYIGWTGRNDSNRYLLEKEFGKIVNIEYKKPFFLYRQRMLVEFFKNPLGSIFIFITRPITRFIALRTARNFNPLWTNIGTSKERF